MKIGLFFGSFNPIHNGHLMLAQYFVEYTDIEQLWFVVTPQNPFKERKTLLDQYARLAFVQDAIVNSPKLRASDIEFQLPIPSFTADTLSYLRDKYEHDFSLILGSDNLSHFMKWKNAEAILNNYKLLVYPRKNSVNSDLINHPSVSIVEAPQIEISSTFIRSSIKAGKDIRHFVPDSIYGDLSQLSFYKS